MGRPHNCTNLKYFCPLLNGVGIEADVAVSRGICCPTRKPSIHASSTFSNSVTASFQHVNMVAKAKLGGGRYHRLSITTTAHARWSRFK